LQTTKDTAYQRKDGKVSAQRTRKSGVLSRKMGTKKRGPQKDKTGGRINTREKGPRKKAPLGGGNSLGGTKGLDTKKKTEEGQGLNEQILRRQGECDP